MSGWPAPWCVSLALNLVTPDVEYQLHIGAVAVNFLLCILCKKNADLLDFYGFMAYAALVVGIAEAFKVMFDA